VEEKTATFELRTIGSNRQHPRFRTTLIRTNSRSQPPFPFNESLIRSSWVKIFPTKGLQATWEFANHWREVLYVCGTPYYRPDAAANFGSLNSPESRRFRRRYVATHHRALATYFAGAASIVRRSRVLLANGFRQKFISPWPTTPTGPICTNILKTLLPRISMCFGTLCLEFNHHENRRYVSSPHFRLSF